MRSVSLALLALFASGCTGRSSAQSNPEPEPGARSALVLTSEALNKNPIVTVKVTRAPLTSDLQVVGSVSFDQNHYALVGPLVPGRLSRLNVGVGQRVRAGQVLAEIESPDVGQAQAAYVSARAHAGAAQANLRRERELATQRISSEREREIAEAQAQSDEAEVRAAVQRLLAFGLTDEDVRGLATGGARAGRVPLRSPIAGTVVARSVTIGQAVERATDAFKIANLDTLWVLLDLYEKDLGQVHVGQIAELRRSAMPREMLHGRVAYVHSIIDEKTRTANVRIELDNREGKLRPGEFVTARLIADARATTALTLTVARGAIVSVEGKPVVFVRTPQGFELRSVELGPSGGDLVEVIAGLADGDEVARDGAFLLKSERSR